MTGAKDSLDYIQFILSNNYKKNYKIINKHLKDKYGKSLEVGFKSQWYERLFFRRNEIKNFDEPETQKKW